ncbi:MAG: hypothetical protein K2K37_04300, partial [Muribaculaceae bacterium]|nr:hypothetical protein [Muribaculaceae bacterium]
MKNSLYNKIIDRICGFIGRQGAFIACAMLLLSLPCIIPVHDGVTFTLPRFALAFAQSLCIATALAILSDIIIKKWFGWTLLGILAFLFTFNVGVAISQEMHFDSRTLRLILQSNPSESAEFLDTYLFKWQTLGMLVTTALILMLYALLPVGKWIDRMPRRAKAFTASTFTLCEALSFAVLLTMSIFTTPQYAYTTLQQDLYAFSRQESHTETIS